MRKIDDLELNNTDAETNEIYTEEQEALAKAMSSYYKRIQEYELSEKDFYPPEDKRVFRSGVNDIPNGDNFNDYCEYFYENYGEDLFDE